MPTVHSLTAALLVLLTGQPVHAGENPRDTIQRALRGSGLDRTDEPMAVRCKYKLTADESKKFVIDVAGDSAGTCGRLVLSEADTGKVAGKIVTFKGRSWMVEIDEEEVKAKDLDDETRTMWLEMLHSQRILWLMPLLQDRRFTLNPAGLSILDGRPVRGVRVSYPGRKDVTLFFDKAGGQLVRAQYEWSESKSNMKAVVQDFRDYRVFDWNAADRKTLTKISKTLNGTVLLKFVRAQTPDPVSGARVVKLIRQLGDDSFAVREIASRTLRLEGPHAVPWLRQAAHSADPEMARRAREICRTFAARPNGAEIAAAVRVLGRHRPKGTAEALLAYLGRCQNESERREVAAALAAAAYRDDEPEPVLLDALKGPQPARGHAAAALGRDDGASARQPGRRLYLPKLKMAHKMIFTGDREKLFEMELLDMQVFNRHDERLFARPAVSSAAR